ncbi:hypothetical protein EV368DRAFT_73145 [Lentinula lateritia]|nr:hypothetical protein EV368DRAFT_73145 [Lentinula lateritia]
MRSPNPLEACTDSPGSDLPSDPPVAIEIDMDEFNAAWVSGSQQDSLPPEFVDSLEAFLGGCSSSDNDSDDEGVEWSDSESNKSIADFDPNSPYFPWPDRETCVLNILRHIPRCAFSRKQNSAIHWAMLALGVSNLPSDRTMDEIDSEMQRMYGIRTIQHEGKLGHIYYTNDFPAIIAQEMSNPNVRSHLKFLPEDSGALLSEANQAQRWLKEIDPDLLTPIHRVAGQDFFTLEPTVLQDGNICMPSRWFVRNKKVFAKAWPMRVVDIEDHGCGWAVQTFSEIEISESDLLLTFKQFQASYASLALMNPCLVVAEEHSSEEFVAWEKTMPSEGNRWRSKSQGKRVFAFPIWLYCDDTSGNVSKKWNKHNSFLFTAAGLPRHLASKESNIHFLSTSNTAQPLEMLDGIVEQLLQAQQTGVWAWDSHLNDIVLLIPSVLALCGDNPMQSEFACHIGFRGCLFCQICWASGKVEDEDNPDRNADDGNESNVSVKSVSGKKSRKVESMKDMITRIGDFMKRGRPRNGEETCVELKSQFVEGSRIGGATQYKRMKTESGIKDTYQGEFIDRIQAITTRKGISKAQKERAIGELKHSFPQHLTSPVWRIKGLDPHHDTPVEILHVILLEVVKYYWRDAVARTKKDHSLLIGRKTLVNYAGSLTGRDFRAVAQAAPFVLHGLLTDDQLEVWKALSALVALVWQPKIHNLEEYLVDLEKTIDYFLDCTCRLTPRWFNKPKFHVLLHLPNHIRCFGPAILFATEGFESFNAIIRAWSVHSNRHAPSKDIAHAMAHSNRIRHLLNGGSFWTNLNQVCAFPQFTSSSSLNLGNSGRHVYLMDTVLSQMNPGMFTSGSETCRILECLLLQSGDRCEVKNWVIWNRSDGVEPLKATLGLVAEILQFSQSDAEKKGLASVLTIQRAIAGEWHSYYGMKQLELVNEFIAVKPQDVLCVVNIQHNCYDKREESTEKEFQVEHTGSQSFVLNTVQMRSSGYLKPFRQPIPRFKPWWCNSTMGIHIHGNGLQ